MTGVYNNFANEASMKVVRKPFKIKDDRIVMSFEEMMNVIIGTHDVREITDKCRKVVDHHNRSNVVPSETKKQEFRHSRTWHKPIEKGKVIKL